MKSIIKKFLSPIVIRFFHYIWWQSKDTWPRNKFLGYEILQCPFDLQIYQELIFSSKPEFILQTGICGGGSIVYFSSILELMGTSNDVKVIGIDIELSKEAKEIKNDRVILFEGSSTSDEVVSKIKDYTQGKKGIIILDSDHSETHVSKELSIYKDFVQKGCYLVVEDTNLNGNPVHPNFGPGPYEAVKKFLLKNRAFSQDNQLWKRNLFSFHQYGWLVRTK
jgi:cephalosporin hydroxylase